MRIIHRPIATHPHFLFEQPISGLFQRSVLRGNPGFAQGDNVDRGIPDRRETRLNPKILWIIDKQAGKIFFRLGVNGIFSRITERAQCDQTVQHRRKDCREAIASLADALQHPALRFFKCAPAHRPKLQRMQEF